jgi:hypothetical protein
MMKLTLAALLLAAPLASQAEERWLHVSVDGHDETVRINLPLTLVTAVAPLLAEHADAQILEMNDHELTREELVEILTAVRKAKDGEYVTVQDGEDDVRISKKGAFLYIHVEENRRHADDDPGETVQVRMPLEVVAALISGKKDELNLVAALEELAKHESGDLVTVKDNEETVRIWIDRKPAS